MRYNFHLDKIIKKYVKKKSKVNDVILLKSAITQIVFLEFKEYAVIDSSVEIAKKFNIYHGFINACLKKIAEDKLNLRKTKISFQDLPVWFQNKTNDLSIKNKNIFLENFYKKPDIHLVFKNNKSFSKFEKELAPSSTLSGFLKEKIKIEEIPSFKDGLWWVQDFSSSFPIMNINYELIHSKIIDVCAAPGGKSFQIMSKNIDVTLNDINLKRINLMKKNLNRLKFKAKIINNDVLKLDSETKYDFIVLDAPCSAIGTIRKNPEILFKKEEPKFSSLLSLQRKMLKKCSDLLNKNGLILYMVCSFLKCETIDQVKIFLENNKDFQIRKFHPEKNNDLYNEFVRNGFMITLPSKYKGFNIDGYFAACLEKRNK